MLAFNGSLTDSSFRAANSFLFHLSEKGTSIPWKSSTLRMRLRVRMMSFCIPIRVRLTWRSSLLSLSGTWQPHLKSWVRGQIFILDLKHPLQRGTAFADRRQRPAYPETFFSP